jgi:hypothetical protein
MNRNMIVYDTFGVQREAIKSSAILKYRSVRNVARWV